MIALLGVSESYCVALLVSLVEFCSASVPLPLLMVALAVVEELVVVVAVSTEDDD
ncbi:hypothetical protein D3C86_2122790 [compost metagenome]